MSTVLIAEKKKAAQAIAEALGPTQVLKKSKYVSVFHVPKKDLYVIPLRGHILSYKNTEEYGSWTKSIPREIITNPDAIEKVPISYAGPFINVLKEYSKKSKKCIIGTDADVEGCNIGLFDAFPIIKKANPNIAVSQLWLSSLQKSEIQQKFNQLIKPKWSWGESGEARAIIDAIIGFSATREATITLKPLLQRFGIKFTSIGRVQTSLLYLIYLREKRINDFIPEPYYTIDAILNTGRVSFKAKHDSNPFPEEDCNKVEYIFQKIKDEKIAKVSDNMSKPSIQRPPTPLNTSKALILLTKTLKISAKQAFSTMNVLYLNKIISYPRTDSDVYKSNFDHNQYVGNFTSHSVFGKYTNKILQNNALNPTKGKKDAGDHPPITPIKGLELNSQKLEDNLQKKVYEILARHYLALFGDPAKESRTKLKLLIKDEPFTARYVSLLYEGFYEIVPFLKQSYQNDILINSNDIPIEKINSNEKSTKPPPKFTDTSLLKLMESNNLGTKATRPVIIDLLQKRNLITRSSRSYSITELGYFLIDNLKDIWLPFLKPDFTKEIEQLLESIRKGDATKEEVVDEIRKRFLGLFDKFLNKKSKLEEKMKQFKVSETKQNNEKKHRQTHSNCPFCKTHPMRLITPKNKSRFLVCSNEQCKKYLSVPKKGRITILKGTCSLCGFNIFKIRTKKGNKWFSYHICPNCWTEGLKDKTNSKGFCPKCYNYEIKNDKCVKK